MAILVESPNAAVEHLTENGTTERYQIGDAPLSIKLVKGKTLSGEEQVLVDQIGDGSIIGSGTILVAPTQVGDGATTGAGAPLRKFRLL